MIIKNNQSFREFIIGFFHFLILVFILAAEIQAQSNAPAEGSSTLWYLLMVALVAGLVGAIYWRSVGKQTQQKADSKNKTAIKESSASGALDADKEMEWLRKNQKLVGKMSKQNSASRKPLAQPVEVGEVSKPIVVEKKEIKPANGGEQNATLLPIFSINRLELARPFDALPLSDDEDLMSAVEQGFDEFEEDEEIRELTVRVLAAFKKRNSVEALSQIALYDLSANLRSKAVTVLSEFDHESVFETILLANADPTREVRAAAARSLTKLTFDRADAWTRISETGEDGRIVQSARAASESGFVDMSFDRLVSRDHKQAYEAFTLMALMIKAGEIEKIFNALENHRDMNVRRAILHTIKVVKDQKALDGLYALLERNTLPIEFQEEVDKTIEEIGYVTA